MMVFVLLNDWFARLFLFQCVWHYWSMGPEALLANLDGENNKNVHINWLVNVSTNSLLVPHICLVPLKDDPNLTCTY